MKATFIETANVQRLNRAIDTLLAAGEGEPRLGLVTGQIGLGKSWAIDSAYINRNLLYVRAYSRWTAGGMYKNILKKGGLAPTTAVVDNLERCSNMLKARQGRPDASGVLVIDEAAGANVTIAADQSRGTPLAVVCKGLAGADGALVENPVDIARAVLTGPGGLADDDLDGPAWAETVKFCDSLGYRAALVYARAARTGDALTNLLGDFFLDWWLAGDGRLKLAPAAGLGRIDENRLAGNLSARVLDDPAAKYTEDEQYVCNQASVRFAYNLLETGDDAWQAQDDGASRQEPASRSRHGARTRDFDLESVREAPVAAAVQAAAVERWGWPLPRFVQDYDGPEALVWEAGDYITATIPWQSGVDGMPKANQIMRIAAVSPALAKGLVKLTLEDTGIFKTVSALADGSYLAGGAVKGGSARDTREY